MLSLSSASPSSPRKGASNAGLAEGHGRYCHQDRRLCPSRGEVAIALQGRRQGSSAQLQPGHPHEVATLHSRQARRGPRNHGGFAFADTRAHGLGDQPQHVYSVRFEARELWGADAAPHDAVYIDLWERYIEPAT